MSLQLPDKMLHWELLLQDRNLRWIKRSGLRYIKSGTKYWFPSLGHGPLDTSSVSMSASTDPRWCWAYHQKSFSWAALIDAKTLGSLSDLIIKSLSSYDSKKKF